MLRHVLAVALAAGCGAVWSVPAGAQVMEIDASGARWVSGQSTPVPAPGSAPFVAMDEDHAGVARSAPAQWRDALITSAIKYNLSPELLEALVWQESRWRPGAISPVGARGLTQLMPATARQLGVDPSDPVACLDGGARYLRMQLDAFGGDLERALAAYNAGPERVRRAGGVPAIRETQLYVAAVLARLNLKFGAPS